MSQVCHESQLVMKKSMELTGETNGSDAIGRSSSRSVSDQSQFSKVGAFSNPTDFNLDVVLASNGDAYSAGFDKVHTVGSVALSDDALFVIESPRIESVCHVHPLVRLFKQRNINIIIDCKRERKRDWGQLYNWTTTHSAHNSLDSLTRVQVV